MRISRWLMAAGVLSVSGVVFAEDSRNCDADDVAAAKAHKLKVKAHETKAEVKSDMQQAGKDVRTGYEQTKEEVKQGAQDVKENVQEKAGEVGQSAAQGAKEAGRSTSQAIREGTQAVQGNPSELPRGELNNGKMIRNTLTTDPLGMIFGSGLNAEYSRALGPESKFSVVGDARFARTQLAGDNVTNFGITAGADYFILGRNNEGLRIGPRLDLGIGGVSGGGALTGPTNASSTFGSFGAGGELGYNWVASNGLTAGAAAGALGRVTGAREATSVFSNAGFGPYGKLNLGYSW